MHFQKMAALFMNPNASKVGDAVAPRRLAEWDPPEADKRMKHDESHNAFSCSVENR